MLTALAISVTMSLAIAACAWWWKGLDEAAREAHKWAWWWGSTFSLAIGGVIFLTFLTTLDSDQAQAALDGTSAVDLLYGGAMGTLAVQCAGYFIAWAVWWLRRR